MIRPVRALSLLPVLALLLALSACTPAPPRDPFAYAATPFSLSVEGTYLPASREGGTPRPFSALITAGAPWEGDPARRDLTVTLTAPATVSGVTVEAALTPAPEGAVGRRVVFTYPTDYGEIRVTAAGDEFDGFLRFAEALLPIGDVTAISPVAADGRYTVTRVRGDREAVFTFAEGTPYPVGVSLTDARGTVTAAVSVPGNE